MIEFDFSEPQIYAKYKLILLSHFPVLAMDKIPLANHLQKYISIHGSDIIT